MRRCAPGRMSVVVVAGIVLALIVTACGDQPSSPTGARAPAEGPAATTVAVPVDSQLEPIARDLVRALSSPEVASDLRDALRASPVVGHEIGFQPYLQTTAGQRLAQAAALARGVTLTLWMQQVAALPALNLYMPFPAHRRSWAGTPGIWVGSTRSFDPHAVALYDPSGVRHVAAKATTTPLVMLLPSRQRARRISPQASGPGAVVQDSLDGGLGGRSIWRSPNGDSLLVDLADYYAVRWTAGKMALVNVRPECGVTGGSPCFTGPTHRVTARAANYVNLPPDTTWIDTVAIYYQDDYWPETDLVWDAGPYHGQAHAVTIQGIPRNDIVPVHYLLLPEGVPPNTTNGMLIDVCDPNDLSTNETPWCESVATGSFQEILDDNNGVIGAWSGLNGTASDARTLMRWTQQPNPVPGSVYQSIMYVSNPATYTDTPYDTIYTESVNVISDAGDTIVPLLYPTVASTSNANVVKINGPCANVPQTYDDLWCPMSTVNPGTATVTVTANGNITTSTVITVARTISNVYFNATGIGLEVGGQTQLLRLATYNDGNPWNTEAAPFVWVADTTIATVAYPIFASDLAIIYGGVRVTAVKTGNTTLNAELQGLTASIPIVVGTNADYITSVGLTPLGDTVVAAGPGLSVLAIGYNAQGQAVPTAFNGSYTFASTQPAIAKISSLTIEGSSAPSTAIIAPLLAGVTSFSATLQGSRPIVGTEMLTVGAHSASISGVTSVTTSGFTPYIASPPVGCNPTCTFRWTIDGQVVGSGSDTLEADWGVSGSAVTHTMQVSALSNNVLGPATTLGVTVNIPIPPGGGCTAAHVAVRLGGRVSTPLLVPCN